MPLPNLWSCRLLNCTQNPTAIFSVLCGCGFDCCFRLEWGVGGWWVYVWRRKDGVWDRGPPRAPLSPPSSAHLPPHPCSQLLGVMSVLYPKKKSRQKRLKYYVACSLGLWSLWTLNISYAVFDFMYCCLHLNKVVLLGSWNWVVCIYLWFAEKSMKNFSRCQFQRRFSDSNIPDQNNDLKKAVFVHS